MERCGRVKRGTGDTTARGTRFACPVSKEGIHTHSHIILSYLLLFHGKDGYVNASDCYPIHALPVVLTMRT